MEWIPFNGRAQPTLHGWMLVPVEDADTQVEMARDDVMIRATGVMVRVGAKALRVSISQSSPANTRPQYGSRPKCVDDRGRCVGGTEFCCTDEIAGPCDGYWNHCALPPASKIEIGVVEKVGYHVEDVEKPIR